MLPRSSQHNGPVGYLVEGKEIKIPREKCINHVCDKALYTGCKKNSRNLIIRKHIAPLKRTKSLNRQVTKLNVYMSNKNTKTGSIPLFLGI